MSQTPQQSIKSTIRTPCRRTELSLADNLRSYAAWLETERLQREDGSGEAYLDDIWEDLRHAADLVDRVEEFYPPRRRKPTMGTTNFCKHCGHKESNHAVSGFCGIYSCLCETFEVLPQPATICRALRKMANDLLNGGSETEVDLEDVAETLADAAFLIDGMTFNEGLACDREDTAVPQSELRIVVNGKPYRLLTGYVSYADITRLTNLDWTFNDYTVTWRTSNGRGGHLVCGDPSLLLEDGMVFNVTHTGAA